MASAAKLYTPEVLGLAASLARWPLDPALPFQGRARSQSCGSTLALSLGTDRGGAIDRLGLRAQACAVGQASAAIFADGAPGRARADISAAEQAIARWLAGEAPMPDWPGLSAIEAAAAFPGRHGAILLPWRAALDALPTAENPV
jgi:NifU-like protein involved in Fe-S cluster formation